METMIKLLSVTITNTTTKAIVLESQHDRWKTTLPGVDKPLDL